MALSGGLGSSSRSGGGRRRPRPLEGLGLDDPSNRPGFLSRFTSDLGLIGKTLLPGLGNMVGAVLSDTVGRAARAVVPGGSDGTERLASWDEVIKPMGESIADTAKLSMDVMASPAAALPGKLGDPFREALIGHARDFNENPGLFTVEHLGNAALVGSVAARPLSSAARGAAGVTKPTRRTARLEGQPSSRSAVRGQRQAQLRSIADSGDSGSGLARAALLSRNVVGRPYTAAVRRGAGLRIPATLTRGDAPSASLREVGEQFRSSAPVRINPETGSAVHVPEVPTSPVARVARQMAETDLGVGLRNRVGQGKRAGGRLVETAREQVSKAAKDLSMQTPAARKAALPQLLRDSARDERFRHVAADPALAPLVGKAPDKWAPEEALAASRALADLDPAGLPAHLRTARPGLVRDLYEIGAGLEEGTLSGTLEADVHLARTGAGADPNLPYGEAVRTAQRRLMDEGQLPEDFEAPSIVDPALAQGPARADLPEHVRRSYDEEIASNTTGPARVERELALGERDLLQEEWNPVVRRTDEGGWRAPEEGEAPLPLTASLTQRQSTGRGKLEKQVTDTRKNLARLEETNPRAASQATIDVRMNRGLREVTKLARAAGRETDPSARAALRDEFVGAKTALEEMALEAGTRIPDNVVPKLERLHLQVDADLGKRAEIVPAARKLEQAWRSNQKPVIKMETRGAVDLRAIERARDRAHRTEMALEDFDARVQDSIEAAPATARPRLEVERTVGRQLDGLLRANGHTQLADELGLVGAGGTLQQMNNAGVTPGYLSLLADGDAVSRLLTRSGVVRPGRLSQAERRRGLGGDERTLDYDRTRFRQDLELATKVIKDDIFREADTRFMKGHDALAAELGIDPDWWKSANGAQQAAVLHERGFVRWDKNAQAPANASGPTQGPDRWVHESIAQGLDNYTRENLANTLIQGVLNPTMRGWKGVTLALRPAWQLGNAVSNMFMASVHGGVDPVTYFKTMAGPAREAMRSYRLGEDPISGRLRYADMDRLVEGRLTRQYDEAAGVKGGRVRESQDVNATAEMVSATLEKQRKGSPLSQAISRSYAANNYVDNLNRLTVAIANADGPQGIEGALRLANEALGDYTKMTKFERQYVKAVFPFWAWQRHIMRLTARQFTPDNITRTTAAMHLTHLAAMQDEWREMVPAYQAGGLNIPGLGTDEAPYLWNNRNLNPFQDALEPFMSGDQFAPARGFARQAGPAPAFALERMTGTSTFTGRPFTQAVPRVDEWGREIAEPPPLGEHLFQSFGTPLGQLGRDLGRRALGRTTARYDSGEAMLWEDQRTKPIMEDLASPLVGSMSPVNLEGLFEAGARAGTRRRGAIERRREQEEEALASQRLPSLFRKP